MASKKSVAFGMTVGIVLGYFVTFGLIMRSIANHPMEWIAAIQESFVSKEDVRLDL